MIRSQEFDREIDQMADTIKYAIENDDASSTALGKYSDGTITAGKFAFIIGTFIAAMCAWQALTH